MDVRATLRNILLVLQRDPAQYRCFGVYWWPLKALLRGVATQAQLYMLGNYENADQAAPFHGWAPERVLQAALEEYQLNVRYGLGRNEVLDQDGEPVRIYDEDAGQ